jgi:hypothetical protein
MSTFILTTIRRAPPRANALKCSICYDKNDSSGRSKESLMATGCDVPQTLRVSQKCRTRSSTLIPSLSLGRQPMNCASSVKKLEAGTAVAFPLLAANRQRGGMPDIHEEAPSQLSVLF